MFFFNKKKEPRICYSTDIHCHVIPGIDDGSRDAVMSADLIERMQQWGIKKIIATPHVTQDSFENTPQTMGAAFDLLKEELANRGNDIEITHSAEYRIDELFMSQLEQGLLIPMPNNYLLVENSYIQEPWGLDQLLYDLKIRDYKPILAHPERYFYYHEKQSRYKEIHNAGTYFQVNLLSLAGYYGKSEKSTAIYLVDNNMVDFLGTDMHNHRHADAIEAYLTSKDYQRILPKLHIRNDIIAS